MMTYAEYERQQLQDDALDDAVDGIVENMNFDDYVEVFDLGHVSDAFEEMTEEEHEKLKEISPEFYSEVEKMHEDYPDCSCTHAVKAWKKISHATHAKIAKNIPGLQKALDAAETKVYEYMEELAKDELANRVPDFY